MSPIDLDKVFFIEARTGCTCCQSENHYRGPYNTYEDAKRRIAYYKSPDSKFCPLASQYAPRGSYSVIPVSVEAISNNRFILSDERVVHRLEFVKVAEDGSVEDNEAERFDEWNYWG